MRAFRVLVIVSLLALGVAPAAAATTSVDVVASGLDSPRHLAFGSRGDLFVAESGRGGSGPCFIGGEGPACMGATGAVTKLDRWLTTRRRGLTDRGSLCRGALANAAHRRLLTRVMPSQVLGYIPQRPSSNSPNSQVGKDDIGQHLWQPDLRPRTDEGEQAVPGKRRHPVGGFQPVTIFGP
jgi:hypothetical protein